MSKNLRLKTTVCENRGEIGHTNNYKNFQIPAEGVELWKIELYSQNSITLNGNLINELNIDDAKTVWEERLVGDLISLLPSKMGESLSCGFALNRDMVSKSIDRKRILKIISHLAAKRLIEQFLIYLMNAETLEPGKLESAVDDEVEQILLSGNDETREEYLQVLEMYQRNLKRVQMNKQAINIPPPYTDENGFDYVFLMFGLISKRIGIVASQPKYLSLRYGITDDISEFARDHQFHTLFLRETSTLNYKYLYVEFLDMEVLINQLIFLKPYWPYVNKTTYDLNDLSKLEELLIIMLHFMYLNDIGSKVFNCHQQSPDIMPFVEWLYFWEEEHMNVKGRVKQQMIDFYAAPNCAVSQILRGIESTTAATPEMSVSVESHNSTTANANATSNTNAVKMESDEIQYVKTEKSPSSQTPITSIKDIVFNIEKLNAALNQLEVGHKILKTIGNVQVGKFDTKILKQNRQIKTECGLWYKDLTKFGFTDDDFEEIESTINAAIVTPNKHNITNHHDVNEFVEILSISD